MDPDKRKAFEARIAGALGKSGGTPEPEKAPEPAPATAPAETETEPVETATEVTPEPEAPAEDEWVELKKEFGSPKALKERLENTKAMQDEAHRRNEEARRRNEETRLLFEETRRMQEQANAQSAALAQMSEADPVAGAQLLAAMNKARTSSATNQLPTDPNAQAVMRKVDEVQRQFAAQQWAYNKAISMQTATEVMNRSDTFKGIDKDLFDGALNEAFNQLVQRDAANLGSVNPMDPASFRPVVEEVVKSIEKRYARIGEARLAKWKAEHSVNAKKAPPSSKGPAASVRTGPPPAVAPAGKNLSIRARGDRFEQLLKHKLSSLKEEVS